jgi:hypothetical protein
VSLPRSPACPYSLGAAEGPLAAHKKAPKRDGDHGLLALFWQSQHNQKRGTSMIPVILALGIAVGMALTTAFAFGLLPLILM